MDSFESAVYRVSKLFIAFALWIRSVIFMFYICLLVCIDVNSSVALGAAPLPPLATWRECDLSSTTKLESKACIYDQLLYHQSNRLLGYDVCQSEFNEGVYIFEDTFENWQNSSYVSTTMKSAKWDIVYNGFTSSFCGSGENFGGEKALTFRGEYERFAITSDVDVRSGGKLEFELFLPPIGYDATNTFCRTGYQGKVYVYYSTNLGENWTQMMVYDPRYWRNTKFFLQQLEIPQKAVSRQTRFKFEQLFFESALDNWALDNVRVLRYLPSDWQTNQPFRSNVKYAQSVIQRAQCCLDTDWCEQRYTAEETNLYCPSFSWYTGDKYLIRLSEIFLCFTCLLNILKFLYISGQDWFLKSRFPFQDEVLEVMELSTCQRWIKKMPLRYRPRKIIPDEYTLNIHTSARMEQELRNQVSDEAGQGDLLVRQEVIERERKTAQKKIRQAQKKLDERKKKKNFKTSVMEDVLQEEQKADEQIDNLKAYVPVVDGGFMINGDTGGPFAVADQLTSDLDRFQRQNHAMLRVPFEVEDSSRWRQIFAVCSLTVFMIVFLFEISYIKAYVIHEPVSPYGVLKGDISLYSYGIVIFAAFCDVKEIFYVLKYVIPCREKWLPQVTLDLSDEVRAMVVANYIVPLSEIKEYGAFSENYVLSCVCGYILGVFPWCLFSILLREAVLQYSSMRIVAPMLGCIMVMRAILGPSFALKISMCLSYLFDFNFKTREMMGVAFQSNKTRNSALNMAGGLATLTLLIASAVAFQWLGIFFAVAIVCGGIYGAFTGCIHELPLRPWMYITTLRGGIWMRLRKRQRCPCLYWGKYCTEMHNYEEIMMLFVTDEVKFMTLINGGIASSYGAHANY
jgi:hypothetical protein